MRRTSERSLRLRRVLDERDRGGFSAGRGSWDAGGAVRDRQDRSKVDDDVAGAGVRSRLGIHHARRDHHGRSDRR